jgi:glycosyltransferase involved in cell wall biosynthesis
VLSRRTTYGVSVQRPKCSVIMPAFRSAAYIEEAARSVLEQTVGDLELIVIDDGCPQRSWELVEKLHDARVIIHRQDNRGATAARNVGLQMARGDCVLFLDADDRLRRDALRRLSVALDTNPQASVAYGRAARMDANGQGLGYWSRPITSREPSGEVLANLLRQNFIRCPAAALIRAACFSHTHGLDTAAFPGADWELWCRLANLGRFVALRGTPVVDYRSHAGNITLTVAAEPTVALRSIALVYDNPALMRGLSARRRSAWRRKREASAYAWLATECMRVADLSHAEQLFRSSRKLAPCNVRVAVLLLFARARLRPPWF